MYLLIGRGFVTRSTKRSANGTQHASTSISVPFVQDCTPYPDVLKGQGGISAFAKKIPKGTAASESGKYAYVAGLVSKLGDGPVLL